VNAPTPAVDYLSTLLASLHVHLDGAVVNSDPRAIHDARVATRRLKAGLDLFAPVLPDGHDRRLRRTLRRLRRRLGTVRDHDVVIGHTAKLRRKRTAAAVAFLLPVLRQSRTAAAQQLSRRVPLAETHVRLEQQARPVFAEMFQVAASAPSLLRDALLARLDEFVRRADALALVDAHTTVDHPPHPHELRIAGKALRYTLEMFVESLPEPSRPKGLVATFKKMQDQLGEWHDFVVLAEMALQLSLDRRLALHNAALQDNVAELTRYLLGRAGRQLSQFVGLWRERGGELQEMIQSLAAPAPAGAAAVADPG
jgi:CHAD domain-containing protein